MVRLSSERCIYCGSYVGKPYYWDPKKNSQYESQMVESGHGKFKKQIRFHKSCYLENTIGAMKARNK